MAFLVLDQLSKRFDKLLAVDRLSLSVERGEFVALLGPSGCGKTTTLQMIAGFVAPTEGSIVLDGEDLLKVRPSRRGLGIVFQSYALFPHMTAAQNVAFGLEMQALARPERQRRVDEALRLVGLQSFATQYPRRLSGGQQQRVALARALVIRPHVLLLDEPLSNLDAKLREEMQIELRQIQRSIGITAILVTHDQAEAMALADRIIVMNHGRVEQIGSPQEVYEHPATPFVASFLGKTNVLPARIIRDERGTFATLADAQLPIPLCAGENIAVAIRPEKVSFAPDAASGLAGTVRTRIFQGNHWLYQVVTPAGLVTVIRQNSGEAMPVEGAAVRLRWRAEDMVVQASHAEPR
jgi:putative spermidine/putrescine transport system ATP-binding protein